MHEMSLVESVLQIIEDAALNQNFKKVRTLSLIHISEPTRLLSISYAVFCLKKKKTNNQQNIYNSVFFFFFLMIRRPPRSTRVRSSAASDVYKRQLSKMLRLIRISRRLE